MKALAHTDAERDMARRYYKDGLSIAVIARRMRIDRTVLVQWLNKTTPPKAKAGNEKEVVVDEMRPSKKTSKLNALSEWQGVIDLYKQVEIAVRFGNRRDIVKSLNRLSKQCRRMKESVVNGYSQKV